MKTYVHLWQYLAEFFSEWEMLQTKVVEKIKTHILCTITPPPTENRSGYEMKNMVQQEKVHVPCILDTYGYKAHTQNM